MGPRYTMSYTIGPRPRRRGLSFSTRELRELGFAILGLSLAVVVLYLRTDLLRLQVSAVEVLLVLAAGFASVGIGVGLHEIAHKLVAQSYGHWAEFRWNPRGIALAFLFAFLGFLYGAPGATMIGGSVTRSQTGKISAAGPMTNLGIALAFLAGELFLLGGIGAQFRTFSAFVASNGAFVNLILAGFNMLPVLPFDGAKVWAWNKPVFAGLLAVIIAILAAGLVFRLFPI